MNIRKQLNMLKNETKSDKRGRKHYERFLANDNPHDDSLLYSLAMYYVKKQLENVSDDDKYDDAQDALELVNEAQDAINTLEDVGLQLQEILPKILGSSKKEE